MFRVSLFLLYYYIKNKDEFIKNISITFCFIIIICLLFSTPTVFVLGGIAISILFNLKTPKNILNYIWGNKYKIIALLAFSLFYYYFYLKKSTSVSEMQNYWNNTFVPTEMDKIIPWLRSHLIPTLGSILNLFNRRNINSYIFISLFLFGMFLLFKQKKDIFICIVTTTLITLFVSALKMYPISSRLLVFWYPLTFIPMATAIVFLLRKVIRKKVLISLCLILITAFTVNANYKILKRGIERQEVVNLISIINTNNNNDTKIILYNSSIAAYDYYQFLNRKDTEYEIFYRDKDIVEQMDSIILSSKNDGKNKIFFLFSHYWKYVFDEVEQYLQQNNYDVIKVYDTGAVLLIIDLE